MTDMTNSQPVKMTRENPRAEFETRFEKALNHRTGRIEDLVRTTVTVHTISRQSSLRTHFGLDKQSLDAMTENVRELNAQLGLSAWRSYRVSILQSGVQGIGAVSGFTNASQAAGTFIGGYGQFDQNRTSIQKTLLEHRNRELDILASQRREEASRARQDVEKMQRLRQQLDSEESTAKSNVLRNI